MSKHKHKPEAAAPDPAAGTATVEINGTTYHLCMTLRALAEAESHFTAQGHDVNVLVALPRLNLNTVYTVFPCALRKHHPNLTFEAAQQLIVPDNVWSIAMAIQAAWEAAQPPKPPREEKPPNPPNP